MKHFIIKSVKAGIARESAPKGEPQRIARTGEGTANTPIRRPISWVMLKQGLSIVPE